MPKKIDLTGQKFGRWTVLYEADPLYDKKGREIRRWHCRCDCDKHTERDIRMHILRSGGSKSCGCLLEEYRNNSSRIDLTGQIIGRWKVIDEAPYHYHKDGSRERVWNCECTCENHTKQQVLQRLLTTGESKGCKKCAHKNPNLKARKYCTYDLSGEYGIGYTRNGDIFYFDLEDYEKIKDYCWFKTKQGYIVAPPRIDDDGNKVIKMHRLVMGLTNNGDTYRTIPDHIHSENKNDNRKQNLRIATCSENKINIPPRNNNITGITGVCFSNSRNKWRAYITKDKKQKHLGYFVNFEDAVKARKEAEKLYYGDFSYHISQLI